MSGGNVVMTVRARRIARRIAERLLAVANGTYGHAQGLSYFESCDAEDDIADLVALTGRGTTEVSLPRMPMPSIQGWPVLRVWRGAVYVRIPSDLARPIDGGCSCDYCKAHPHLTPSWDTLGVPIGVPLHPPALTWTLHAPEWRAGENVRDDAASARTARTARL